MQTRRQFLQTGAASVVCASTLLRAHQAMASPFGLPLGLQLYSVRELLPKDYAGTLAKVAALGYREVEAAGFYDHSAQQVKQAMATAGLHCVSAHYPWGQLSPNLDSILEFHKELGAKYIICSSPGHKDQNAQPSGSHGAPLTMDDWHWNAEQFNRVGEKVKAAGFKFGYHNHVAEFHAENGMVPFDELVRHTEPSLVTFEMDCGWVTVGGGNPVAYLHKYPDRISMLHVKDFKHSETRTSTDAPPPAAQLGQGTADYRAIFAAAKKGEIQHYFVEQEHFDIPPFEALKIDADYMKALTV